jgi:hypothetical protein
MSEHVFPIDPKNLLGMGLTKRELFAAMAMQGLCSIQVSPRTVEEVEARYGKWEAGVAALAVRMADALLEELQK